MLAESLPIKLYQAVAMTVLLVMHGLQCFSCLRKLGFNPLGQIGINPPILLFSLDRERQNFLHGEVFKRLCHGNCVRYIRCGPI